MTTTTSLKKFSSWIILRKSSKFPPIPNLAFLHSNRKLEYCLYIWIFGINFKFFNIFFTSAYHMTEVCNFRKCIWRKGLCCFHPSSSSSLKFRITTGVQKPSCGKKTARSRPRKDEMSSVTVKDEPLPNLLNVQREKGSSP
jgi:hypothetical protein